MAKVRNAAGLSDGRLEAVLVRELICITSFHLIWPQLWLCTPFQTAGNSVALPLLKSRYGEAFQRDDEYCYNALHQGQSFQIACNNKQMTSLIFAQTLSTCAAGLVLTGGTEGPALVQ